MSPNATDLVEVLHAEQIMAAPGLIYRLLAEVEAWPVIFGPTVYIDVLERAGGQERLHLWATANGEVRDWVSRRTLDPTARTIDFRQEVCSSPVAEMGGRWQVVELAAGSCEVRLWHDYRAASPEALPWIAEAVERNSRAELAALKRIAEQQNADSALWFSFTDTVTAQAPVEPAYRFLAEAGRWPDRLSHVAALDLQELPGGVQQMTMHTKAADATTHLTESIRVCLPGGRIVYKQTTTPPIMAAHTGEWTVTADGDRITIASQHTVRLDPAGIVAVLGPDVTAAEAAQRVQAILSGNSRLTLAAASSFAESKAPADG